MSEQSTHERALARIAALRQMTPASWRAGTLPELLDLLEALLAERQNPKDERVWCEVYERLRGQADAALARFAGQPSRPSGTAQCDAQKGGPDA